MKEPIPYFDQLVDTSRETGCTLEMAAKICGVADTTVWRWRTGRTEPSLKITRMLIAAMWEYAEKQKAA